MNFSLSANMSGICSDSHIYNASRERLIYSNRTVSILVAAKYSSY